ncbi:MAG: type II toxin-antitoxin system VapC family toxin [Actinomycetota bacterium]
MDAEAGGQRASTPLVLDSSALVRRYVADRQRPLVVDTMAAAGDWIASALARSEVLLALHQSASGPQIQEEAWSAVHRDWDDLWEIPLDGRCLARATEIGARYGITLVTAVHLAAADRLPRPVDFLTFDRRQLPDLVLGLQRGQPLFHCHGSPSVAGPDRCGGPCAETTPPNSAST